MSNENIQGSLDAVASVGGVGNGGRIEITSLNGSIEIPNGIVDVGAQEGSAGEIFIQAGDDVSLAGLRAFIFSNGSGNGGNIQVISINAGINTTAGEISSTAPGSNAGNITLRANGDIFTEDISSQINNVGGTGNTGNAGVIDIRSFNGIINTTAGLVSSTSPDGNGGNITLRADGDILTDSISSQIISGGVGDAGKIDIRSDSGIVDTTDGSLNASTPDGVGGEVFIEADQDITTGTIRSSFGSGNSGDVTLISNNGSITNVLGSITYSNDRHDNVELFASENVEFDRIDADRLTVSGGAIFHDVNSSFDFIDVDGDARFTSTLGDIILDEIDAGSLNVNANGNITTTDVINVVGTAQLTSAEGDITLDDITADNLQVDAGGLIIGNGILTTSGGANFTSQASGAGTVELASQNDTVFGNSLIGGDLIVDVDGQTSQTGVLQVAGDIIVDGEISEGPNALLVNTVGDPRQEITLDDGSVMITGVGTVLLGEDEMIPPGEESTLQEYPANLTVNILPEVVLGFNQVLDNETAINISNPANSFGGTVELRTETGDADIISGIPGIAQVGPISVMGTATFNATNVGNIGLTAADNQFNEIEFVGRDVDLVSSSGFELLTSVANGDLSIETEGTLTQASDSSLRVLGETHLVVVGTDLQLGNVNLNNSAPVTFIGQSLIGGDFNLEPFEIPSFLPGVPPIVPATVLQIPGTTLQVAGMQDDNILANNSDSNPDNDFELDVLPTNAFQEDGSGNIFITDVGPVNVTDILSDNLGSNNLTGNLTVNSLREGLRFEGEAFNDETAINLSGNNQLSGPISIQTNAPTVVDVSGTPNITQSDSLAVGGTATFNAETGIVNLPEVTNQFGTVAFSGADVTIQEQDTSRLGNSDVTGSLNFTSGGAITQQGDIRVVGADSTAQFTSLEPDASITLDGANQIAGSVSFNTSGNGDVTLVNTVSETQLGTSQISGNFTVDSGAGISQTGPLSIAGQTTLNAGGNDIDLSSTNDFRSVAITGANAVTLADINDINLENSQSFGDFTVTAQGLVDTQDIAIANGSIQLISEAGAVDTTDGTLRARFVSGQGGNVDIRANGNLTSGEIFVNGFPSGSISLTSETGTLLLDGFDIRSNTLGSGTGGGVTLNGDTVRIINGGRVTSSAVNNGTGGTVTVNAREFLIEGIDNPDGDTNSASITGIGTDTFRGSAGIGGDQIINATELIQISGTQPGEFTPNLIDQTAVIDASLIRTGLTASSLGSGEAGDLSLNTPRLIIQDGAGVATAALGTEVQAGAGGDMDVMANAIELRGLAGLATATLGAGAAGDIRIRGRGSTAEDPVPASQVFLYDGAAITADAIPEATEEIAELFGLEQPSNTDDLQARAGNIDITANDVLLDNRSRITTSSTAGDGGTITLSDVGALTLQQGQGIGGIFTDGGAGDDVGRGGGINIEATGIFAIDQENSDISARAFIGRGGGIEIEVQSPPIGIRFRPGLTPFSDITAGSDQGPSGTVDIEALGLDPTQGLQALPEEPQGPEAIEGCAVSANNQAAGFFDLGRGGKLPGPEDLVTADTIIAEWIPLELVNPATSQAEQTLRYLQHSKVTPYLIANCGIDDE
ncbi:MAG: beta strand repeat-containing protein [Leptolyngbyaceae cyanobacterium]